MARSLLSSTSWAPALATGLALLSAMIPAVSAGNITYIEGTNAAGVTKLLADNRDPALYTKDFGDCLGGQSLINVTHFDAAYYADNMTVMFHLDGSTNVANESIMSMCPRFAWQTRHANPVTVYISVFACKITAKSRTDLFLDANVFRRWRGSLRLDLQSLRCEHQQVWRLVWHGRDQD